MPSGSSRRPPRRSTSAKANVEQAQLNLGYTTITTPVTGLSSYAQVQDGSYVSGANSLLTYVAQIDTLWVNFSVSENDMLRLRSEKARRPAAHAGPGPVSWWT